MKLLRKCLDAGALEVTVSGLCSTWRPVTKEVLQGCIHGYVLFSILLNYQQEAMGSLLHPLVNTCQTSSATLCPVCSFPVQKTYCQTKESSVECTQDSQGCSACLVRRGWETKLDSGWKRDGAPNSNLPLTTVKLLGRWIQQCMQASEECMVRKQETRGMNGKINSFVLDVRSIFFFKRTFG